MFRMTTLGMALDACKEIYLKLRIKRIKRIMGCAMSTIIFEFLEFTAKPLRDVSNVGRCIGLLSNPAERFA